MFKPTIAYICQYDSTTNVYNFQIEEGKTHQVVMSVACTNALQQYINSVHPSIEIPREPTQSTGTDWDIALNRDPVILPGMHMDWIVDPHAPDDRANDDHKEMDDGVTY